LVPAPVYLGYVSQVAGGFDYSVALLTNGTVAAWGRNEYGQTNPLPANLTNVKSIAARGYQALALRSDGTVAIWGAWYDNFAVAPSVPCRRHGDRLGFEWLWRDHRSYRSEQHNGRCMRVVSQRWAEK